MARGAHPQKRAIPNEDLKARKLGRGDALVDIGRLPYLPSAKFS